MTAARAYVLGSEELYNEEGYTAFSRHRELCRFYINAGEPAPGQLELDPVGPERSEVLRRLEHTLGRSRAQELALDVHERDAALRGAPDGELAARAGALEALLADFPAQAREAEHQARELARQADRIGEDAQRLAASRSERERLGRRERAARTELDARIARQAASLAGARGAYGQLEDSLARAQAAGDEWLEAHGVELGQLTVIESELAGRRERAYQDAIVRAAHDPSPEVERELGPRPESFADQERWDRAALALEGYRIRYEEIPGPELPADVARRPAWERARAAIDDLHAPEPAELAVPVEDLGPDLGP